MRVLEDHLCLEAFGKRRYAEAWPTWRVIEQVDKYKSSKKIVMDKYGLTDRHFEVLKHLKHNGSLYPRSGWTELVHCAIAEEDDDSTRAIKYHLYCILASFLLAKQGFGILKSPIYHRNDDKFRCW